ncbi:TonB-dependent Receptor Plug Domain protein [compost metagenome]
MKITIPQPCHENWNQMTPDEKGRFCEVCSKSVRDFTRLSDLEIIESVSENTNICGNFRVDQLDRNLNYSFINSLFMKFAVGFVLTSGGIVSAQTPSNQHHGTKDSIKVKVKIPETPANLDLHNNQKIRIGGFSSTINENNQPLYIVDGKIIDVEVFRKIDSKKIEKIEVLKDASATALYGRKGKNGVVIITMKEKPKKRNAKLQ